MEAKNVTRQELELALAEVSKRYGGNIIWNREPEALNPAGTRFAFTLRTKGYENGGYRRTHSGKKNPSACWHVHGYFFEALLAIQPDAVIRTGLAVIDRNGGNWQDRNIGSLFQPLLFSDACDCDERDEL